MVTSGDASGRNVVMRKQRYSYVYVRSSVDLVDQLLGAIELLELLVARSETDLLISQFPHRRNVIVGMHGNPLLDRMISMVFPATPIAH